MVSLFHRERNDTVLSEHLSVIRNLFHESTYNKIIDYMNNHIRYQPSVFDDLFVRNYIYNDSFFVEIHKNLTDIASEIFKEKLKPSYCFLSMYRNGGSCPLHVDRNQCRYTIDYLISSTEEEPWPIAISTPISDQERQVLLLNNKTMAIEKNYFDEIISNFNFTEVNLNPNDAVAYSGTNQWHYRPRQLSNTANLVFFHFVTEDFDGPLE